jgi:hypothetical protein
MPLFQGTQQQYYGQEQFTTTAAQATGGGSAGQYALTFPDNETLLNNLATMPDAAGEMRVDTLVSGTTTTGVPFEFNNTTNTITLGTPVAVGAVVTVNIINPQLGNYQFISLKTIIDNFIISYVGRDKIIPKVRRADIAFHAQRAIQELSYDTLKSTKSQELEVPPSLKVALPFDYVNYVKVAHIDNDGIERILYPARKTSNPTAILQNDDFSNVYDSGGNLTYASDSDAWTRYQGNSSTEDTSDDDNVDSDFDILEGQRYGISPENAQFNGIFYIDEEKGYIHFDASMNGNTCMIKYISDGLATDDEMIVHKFAEEAVYKHIAYAIASTHTSVPPTYIPLLKRERFATKRQAKLRLSNLKSEELAQIMRGKSKWIKH